MTKSWTEGNIITPLQKKGSPYNPDNYRGITVASTIGKVFRIGLNNRVLQFCEEHGIIDERQSSYRQHICEGKKILKKYCDFQCRKTCTMLLKKAQRMG